MPPAPIAAPAPAALRGPLALVLQESADEEADQKRLAAVFRLLQEHPGNDQVHLTIRTRESDTIDLALPTAALDDALRAALEAALNDPIALTSAS